MKRHQWEHLIMGAETVILDAMKILDANDAKIIMVADAKGKLQGTITDGDVRRGLLRGIAFTKPVKHVMNKKPIKGSPNAQPKVWARLMKEHSIRQLPIVDKSNRIVDLIIESDLGASLNRPNIVVIMAGGEGNRLRPLTLNTPKPLVTIGNKPILETNLTHLIDHGFQRFYLSVNYKNEMLKQYFQDGSQWGVDIRYIDETTKMGTAGALSLLPEKPKHPFLVMNADLLTNVNLNQLMEFHQEQKHRATMCVREYDFEDPYGVVKIDDHAVVDIDEKPLHKFFVNAGIYVLEPEVLKLVTHKKHLDMNQLIEKINKKRGGVGAFPIHEYWLDIGRQDDLEKAKNEYSDIFET